MEKHPDRDRLLKFPKEVLVDYFLRRQLFEIDWRSLEIASLLFQYRHLIEKAGHINEALKIKGISKDEWFRLDDEWERVQKRIDNVSNKLSELQGIGSERAR